MSVCQKRKEGGNKREKRQKLFSLSLSLTLLTSRSAPSPSPTPPPSRTASWRSSRRTEPGPRPSPIWCSRSRRRRPGNWACSRGRPAKSARRRSQRPRRRWCRPRGRRRGPGRSRKGSRIPVKWVFFLERKKSESFFGLLFSTRIRKKKFKKTSSPLLFLLSLPPARWASRPPQPAPLCPPRSSAAASGTCRRRSPSWERRRAAS